MKTTGLEQIIGKTITGVVVKTSRPERIGTSMQMHLVFSDGSCFEMYTSFEQLCFAGSLDLGGFAEAVRYDQSAYQVVFLARLNENGEVVSRRL